MLPVARDASNLTYSDHFEFRIFLSPIPFALARPKNRKKIYITKQIKRSPWNNIYICIYILNKYIIGKILVVIYKKVKLYIYIYIYIYIY